MYHAKALIAETNLKISEISREIGISNSQYFRKIFQEFTGQSPCGLPKAAFAEIIRISMMAKRSFRWKSMRSMT